MVAERFDHDAAEEGLPLHDQAFHRLADFRIVGVRGERAGQRRPDELRRFDFEGLEEPRDDRLVRVALEVGVGDGAHAVVLVGHRRDHHVARARIVEAGEDDERAEPHVLVGVLLDRGQQRRDRRPSASARRTVRAAADRIGKSTVPSRSMADRTCSGVIGRLRSAAGGFWTGGALRRALLRRRAPKRAPMRTSAWRTAGRKRDLLVPAPSRRSSTRAGGRRARCAGRRPDRPRYSRTCNTSSVARRRPGAGPRGSNRRGYRPRRTS